MENKLKKLAPYHHYHEQLNCYHYKVFTMMFYTLFGFIWKMNCCFPFVLVLLEYSCLSPPHAITTVVHIELRYVHKTAFFATHEFVRNSP